MRKLQFLAPIFVVAILAVKLTGASNPPADLCSLLPAAELSKVAGKTYDPPIKSVAPPELPHTPAGTNCKYLSKDGSQFQFIVFVDRSRALAVRRFVKLTAFFRHSHPLKGLADDAYYDEEHAITARKGRVRFYVTFFPQDNFEKEKQLIELVAAVAGRL